MQGGVAAGVVSGWSEPVMERRGALCLQPVRSLLIDLKHPWRSAPHRFGSREPLLATALWLPQRAEAFIARETTFESTMRRRES